jgi:hypothetical protein
MDCTRIRRTRDQPVQRVDLPDEMTLAQSPDSRIAGHRAHGVAVKGDQRDPGAPARRSRSRLAARMAAAHHNDIEPAHAAPLPAPLALVKALFHVEQPPASLADAKAAEQTVEHLFRGRPSGEPVKAVQGHAELLGDQQRIVQGQCA